MLSQGEYRRVGAVEEQRFEGRVVATNSRELLQVQADGDFRQDLYYRLATFVVRMPPLRERPEDLRELLCLFLTRLARECGAPPPILNADALLELHAHAHAWPGNVCELNAIVTRIWLDRPREITADHVQGALCGALGGPDEECKRAPNLPDLPADFADEPTLVPEEPFDFDAAGPPGEPNIVFN